MIKSWPNSSRISAGALEGCLLAWLLIGAGSPTADLHAGNGDVLAVSTVLQGKDLSDIAFDSAGTPAGGSFWVLGKNTGKIYHLSLDLNTILGEIPNPHGVGNFPTVILSWGIAYRSLTKTLFVLAQDGPDWKVREVKTDGTEVAAGAFKVTPPDGAGNAALRGLSYDNIAREFWYLDANNDKLVRTGTDGVATRVCSLPLDDPPEITLRGEGLCFELHETSPGNFEQRVYVAYGDIFRDNPSRIVQISDACVESGVEIPLSKINFSSSLQGFQTFRAGQQRRVAVVTSEGKIAQVEQVLPGTVPPSMLQCSLTLTNKVSLTWENHGHGAEGAYGGQIAVLRNGSPISTLAGSAKAFVDETPPEGTSSYSLRASDTAQGALSSESFPCRSTVGPGGIVRWAPFPGAQPFDVARNPSTGAIYVTDNIGPAGSGKIYELSPTLEPVGEVPSPWSRPGAIAFLPAIAISGQNLTDILAVGRTDGMLVRLMAESGAEKTTLVFESGPNGCTSISAITYIPAKQEFAYLCQSSSPHKIVFLDATGRYRRECVPKGPLQVLPETDLGVTYDPLQDTFLSTFQDGIIRELYNSASCNPSGFEISLESLGEGYQRPGFFGGIQIADNTLLVCCKASRAVVQVLIFPAGPTFRRGDFDRNNDVNLTDVVACANYLFRSGPSTNCLDAADVNDDGEIDVSDPVYLLFYLFLEGTPPPAPFPDAGSDPTFRDNIGCE